MKLADRAWSMFDDLVNSSPTDSPSPTPVPTTTPVPTPTPWRQTATGPLYEPDVSLLERLLSVPLQLQAITASGIPAKAVDVWLAHELRRAGLGSDEVWPRASSPRVLPRELAILLERLPKDLARSLRRRLIQGGLGPATSSDARVLGKAYVKQVDVVVSQWSRGPEILISTKRMGSSLTNNAFNRIEESYGDAHNLRGRHPLAAIGYLLVVRQDAIRTSPGPASRLFDLVAKMAEEPGGYDASCVIVADWEDTGATVTVDIEAVAPELRPARFLQVIIDACLDRTPVDFHVEARERRGNARLPVEEGESEVR